jgi:uncharacterized protein (TIGR04141 family)
MSRPPSYSVAIPAPRGTRRRSGMPRTRLVTLYRLLGGASHAEALNYLTQAAFDNEPAVEPVPIADMPGVVIHATDGVRPAEWCADLSATTGLAINYDTQRAGGLLFIEVDQVLYAISYGTGHLWLDDSVIDPRFGISFVARCLDCNQVKDLVRRVPGARGRTDSTLVPGGAAIWHLGIERFADVVRRLGGRITSVPLTANRLRDRPITVEGAAGLKIRIGVEPHDLVADIRAIADVCRNQSPHPDLAFIDNVQPVTTATDIDRLNCALEDMLGPNTNAPALTVAVPEAALAHLPFARSFQVKIGSVATSPVQEVSLEAILNRTSKQAPGQRLEALRTGWVEMKSSENGAETIGRSRALGWVEASISLEDRRFVLVDGSWYELGATYAEEIRGYVQRLLGRSAQALALPDWRRGEEERYYNLRVHDTCPGYVCLDRRGVTTRLHRTHGVEICDLLGPDNELIHVKKASGSAPLSHLFNQGLVSAQTLLYQPGASRDFADLVRQHGRGRTIATDFTPKKIVFAILLKDGEDVNINTLFPFAQVALRQAAVYLEGKAEVEVVGIRRS